MNTVPNYEIISKLYIGRRSTLFRAKRTKDSRKVVIKMHSSDFPSDYDIQRYQNEYEIGGQLVHDNIIKYYELIAHRHGLAIIVEDFDAIPLEAMIPRTGLDIMSFLRISTGLTRGLDVIHHNNIVHKDINCHNIVIDPKTQVAKYIDFEISSHLQREICQILNPRETEGTLAYISPEQTGRMNKAMDYRADFYSLGITFYKMLTGVLPFGSGVPMELLHAHIAIQPQPPHVHNPDIPKPVSNIVMKLMEKAPEDRYQSANGILADLEECERRLCTAGHIEDFPLGRKDISEKFQIPEWLYGREKEIRTLLKAFHRVAKGQAEILLVSGYSGVGKSSLVHEVKKTVAENGGFFVWGKFDQLNKGMAYSALSQAFREWVGQIMCESDEIIASWQKRLLQVLGKIGRVVIDVVPEIESIIGKQPSVPELGAADAQNRFNLAFLQFMSVLTEETVLVIFLDDLQWADAASLKLLILLASNPLSTNLLIIGAYRSNEVSPMHPTALAIEKIKERTDIVEEMSLYPLSPQAVNQLVADTLKSSLHKSAYLADLLYQKTEGNPFFLKALLHSIYMKKMVMFAYSSGWTWNIKEIEQMQASDNVAEFMAGRITDLPQATCELMKTASCLGSSFTKGTLSIATGKRMEKMLSVLHPALNVNMLIDAGKNIKFAHDRVQEGAYSLIPESIRKALHLAIGREWLKALPEEEVEEHIFDIIHQFNHGLELVTDEKEKQTIAELNLKAGIKAADSAAYETAIQYLGKGIQLLGINGWERDYQTALSLHLTLAKCEFLVTHLDTTEQLLVTVLEKAKGYREKARAYLLKVDLHTTRGENDKSVESAIRGLALLGIDISAHPDWTEVMEQYNKFRENMGNRPLEAILDLHRMTNPDMNMAMQILSALMPPALFTDKNLLCLEFCYMVNISLTYGNTIGSPNGYAYFGAILCSEFKKYEEGYRIGKIGYDLMEKTNMIESKAKVCLSFGNNVNFYINHLRTDLDYLYDGFKAALETGDKTYSCYCCNHIITVLLAVGEPLDKVYEETEKRLNYVRKTGFEEIVDIITSQQCLIQNLRGYTENFSSFSYRGFVEEEFEKHLNSNRMSITVCWYYIRKLQARYMSDNYEDAMEAAKRANSLLWSSVFHVEVPEYYFFYALTLAGGEESIVKRYEKDRMGRLKEERDRFLEWSENGKENFYHKYALIEAEISRLCGDDLKAMNYYDIAIESAGAGGFIQNEAIANELAGRFWMERKKEHFASIYLTRAWEGYVKWHARRKADNVLQKYGNVVRTGESTNLRYFTIAPTVADQVLDIASVVKSSQAISKEISLEKLLTQLMNIIIENAGAQRGYLLLRTNGDLRIEASASAEEKAIEVLQSVALEDSSFLSKSVIRYVIRNGEHIIISDASQSDRFSRDSYIAKNKPKSILCIPFRRTEGTAGVLYMENNLVAGAFTENYLEILQILLAQAAISIENAELFEKSKRVENDLREKERQLRQIMDALPHMIFAIDKEGQLIFANKMLLEIYGATAEQVVGKSFVDLLGEMSPEEAERLLKDDLDVIETGKSKVIPEQLFTDRNGNVRVLQTHKIPFDIKGRLTSLGIAVDVTELKGLEKELRAINEKLEIRVAERTSELNTALEGLKAKEQELLNTNKQLFRRNELLRKSEQDLVDMNKELEAFSYSVSHDLRAPLRGIDGFSQVLLEDYGDALDEKAKHYLQRVRAGTQNMGRLIDDMLNLSRIGRHPMEKKTVNLQTIAREAYKTLEDEWKERKVNLTLHQCPPALADPNLMQVIFVNLLSNALKFTRNRATAEIELGFETKDEQTVFHVRDNGVGFDMKYADKLFISFHRLHRAEEYEGVGVGLTIVQRIIHRHGGRIWVESDLDVGTTFWFVL
ncbi:MAG: hypothetical protein BA872_10210 [Desulfobacterales bacterium C00003060]|nr:MAG: hypothetical protein BA872_10210 [Desulfobacterales bacterium C00003060]